MHLLSHQRLQKISSTHGATPGRVQTSHHSGTLRLQPPSTDTACTAVLSLCPITRIVFSRSRSRFCEWRSVRNPTFYLKLSATPYRAVSFPLSSHRKIKPLRGRPLCQPSNKRIQPALVTPSTHDAGKLPPNPNASANPSASAYTRPIFKP